MTEENFAISSSPRRRGSSTPRLIGSITGSSGILDHPPARVMTSEYDFAFSRLTEPEVCLNLPPQGGSRECRVLAAPAVSCAIVRKEQAHEHTGAAGAFRHSLRNGFTAYIVLSPENGSFASVAPEKLASRGLDASTATSGPHDFAVRFMRIRLFAHSTSTASHHTFVTIAKRPSSAVRRAELNH